MLSKLRTHLERTAAEKPVLLAFMVVVATALIVIPVSIPYYLEGSDGFLENLVAEMHGVLFDLLIIGWFLFWLNKIAERRVRNTRYREEIEDYLGWHSNEATLRIVGNVRRLNRGGVVSGFRLTEAHLENAKLGSVEMDESDLWGAHLEGASLREAQLNDSNLAGANLEGADLERACMSRTDLRGANLNETDLERATLVNADMRGVSLVGADLQYAVLSAADLRRSKIIGANLRAANLQKADLSGATLESSHLRGADLQNANLIDADLTSADLLSANLKGARLPSDEEDLIAMFEKAKSLFGADFDPSVAEILRGAIPSMFELAQGSRRPAPTVKSVEEPA